MGSLLCGNKNARFSTVYYTTKCIYKERGTQDFVTANAVTKSSEIFARRRANVKYPAAPDVKYSAAPNVIIIIRAYLMIVLGTFVIKAASEQMKFRKREGKENEEVFL